MLKSSHGLLYAKDLSHRICCFFLCCRSHMCIGIQREPSGKMTQHTGYSFYVNSVLQRNGCKGVAEVVESDLWDSCSGKDSFEHIVDAVR